MSDRVLRATLQCHQCGGSTVCTDAMEQELCHIYHTYQWYSDNSTSNSQDHEGSNMDTTSSISNDSQALADMYGRLRKYVHPSHSSMMEISTLYTVNLLHQQKFAEALEANKVALIACWYSYRSTAIVMAHRYECPQRQTRHSVIKDVAMCRHSHDTGIQEDKTGETTHHNSTVTPPNANYAGCACNGSLLVLQHTHPMIALQYLQLGRLYQYLDPTAVRNYNSRRTRSGLKDTSAANVEQWKYYLLKGIEMTSQLFGESSAFVTECKSYMYCNHC